MSVLLQRCISPMRRNRTSNANTLNVLDVQEWHRLPLSTRRVSCLVGLRLRAPTREGTAKWSGFFVFIRHALNDEVCDEKNSRSGYNCRVSLQLSMIMQYAVDVRNDLTYVISNSNPMTYICYTLVTKCWVTLSASKLDDGVNKFIVRSWRRT